VVNSSSDGCEGVEARREQHGVIARRQLLELGFSPRAIEHRLAKGRLFPIRRGVYAVGRPDLTRHGRWMAAVLACGGHAFLSHESAAALYRIRDAEGGAIDISLLAQSARRRPGINLHRRANLDAQDVCRHLNIPVTSPIRTLLDLATLLEPDPLEAAVNEADKRELIDSESLRAALDGYAGQPGVAALRGLLDRRTLTLTDSELERRLIPLAAKAGLSAPITQQYINGSRVDFYWPELGLVVETDGLRYHRTPAQQTRDRLRDQAHTAAGLTALRFTHAQVHYEPDHVTEVLRTTAHRLARSAA
jgi:very-short-patch-repair endonuclease